MVYIDTYKTYNDFFPIIRYSCNYNTFIYVAKFPNDIIFADENGVKRLSDEEKEEKFLAYVKEDLNKTDIIFNVAKLDTNVYLFELGEEGHIKLYYYMNMNAEDIKKSASLMKLLEFSDTLYLKDSNKPAYCIQDMMPWLKIIYTSDIRNINFELKVGTVIKIVPQTFMTHNGTNYGICGSTEISVPMEGEDYGNNGCISKLYMKRMVKSGAI